jgi:hypothetical protein
MDGMLGLKKNVRNHLLGAAIILAFLYGFLIHYGQWSWLLIVSLAGSVYYYKILPWKLNQKAVGVGS